MSLPQLVRNLRRERNPMIVYDGKATTWKEIFKKHPIESKENESLFHQIENSKEFFGDKNSSKAILILRSGHTGTILRKIANNSIKDCISFYEVAKKTITDPSGLMNDSIHLWFKVNLSALYLAHKDAPEELNLFKQLDEKNKEKAICIAFQYYGEQAYKNFLLHESELKVEHFNDKLILWYWDTDARQHNFIDRVLDEIKKTQPLVFDLDYIAENLKPNNLLKYQTIEIQERFISLEDLKIKSERVNVNYADHVCLLQSKKEVATIDEVFNLLKTQIILKGLGNLKKQEKYPAMFAKSKPEVENSYRCFDGKTYKDISDVLSSLSGAKLDFDSMSEFVEKNLQIEKEDVKMPNVEFWQELKTLMLSFKLSEELVGSSVKNKKIKL